VRLCAGKIFVIHLPKTYVENCCKAQDKNFCPIENVERKTEVEEQTEVDAA